MPLKLTCPHCGHPARLNEPYPLPGVRLQCEGCASGLTVSYPDGVVEQLKARGRMFLSEEAAVAQNTRPPRAAAPPPPTAPPATHAAPSKAAPRVDRPTEVPTTVDPTVLQPPDDDAQFERTVRTGRTPYGALPAGANEPEAAHAGFTDADDPTELDRGPIPVVQAPRRAARAAADPGEVTATEAGWKNRPTPEAPKAKRGKVAAAPPAPPGRRGRGCLRSTFLLVLAATLLIALVGGITAFAGYKYYASQLPTLEALQAYRPPSVTMVYDHKGRLLGEIYEERRYVVPLDAIPKHVQDAFIASEDASFWSHGGVDYMGLSRAVMKEVFNPGAKSQGASTITMQVTRNFLLTRDKTYERKIKEILLSWRIEEAYTKEHILYLYLNEIYLGSGAYGVEAASRTYFDKNVGDLTVAEAALLAGLPQRPSDYSPHRNWPKAKDRQGYVLGQMESKGYLDAAAAAAARAEEVRIVERTNEFLTTAPHFTEYVRRYVIEKYGHAKVYKDGLKITTTCDLDLQRTAQQHLIAGVDEVDQRMGFRREGVETLPNDAAIATRRAEHEAALIAAHTRELDPAGRIAPPERSVLVPGRVYTGVLLEVDKKWVRVAVGAHEGIIPIAWADWAYKPNPRMSWRYRTQTDLTEQVDADGDGKKDGGILRKGDVILVRIEGLSTKDAPHDKVFKGTPGADAALVAARLWQKAEVEGALLSYDLGTGAVRAMVGGADYETSEFNRAIQARRQVGSTFKPIVYAAAIDSRKLTTASMVTDGPLAYATDQDFIWKPGNYGDDYMGNITLRKALALSRNTCTVRVLDAIDPGMNNDVVYGFTRALGIGGPPAHALPEGRIPSPSNDLLCPWVREHKESTICMDHFPPRTDPEQTNTRHRALLTDADEHWCRSCDLSMGLGSASLTMEELMRAYSAFAAEGKLIEPYYIEEVVDRDGEVLEKHAPAQHVQVIDPALASIMSWLLQGVVQEGTAARANSLGVTLAGKTGTTNDEKDTWFVGYSPDVITAVWVGFDTPKPLGISSTGGRTALPIWMEYMKVAAPKEKNRDFPMHSSLEWASIEDATGRRVERGGRRYPFLPDTAPQSTGISAGQVTLEDLTTEL